MMQGDTSGNLENVYFNKIAPYYIEKIKKGLSENEHF